MSLLRQRYNARLHTAEPLSVEGCHTISSRLDLFHLHRPAGSKIGVYGCLPDFARESNVALPAGFYIKKMADGLFYENGRDFALGRMQ